MQQCSNRGHPSVTFEQTLGLVGDDACGGSRRPRGLFIATPPKKGATPAPCSDASPRKGTQTTGLTPTRCVLVCRTAGAVTQESFARAPTHAPTHCLARIAQKYKAARLAFAVLSLHQNDHLLFSSICSSIFAQSMPGRRRCLLTLHSLFKVSSRADADRWLTRHSLYKISCCADADRWLSRHSLYTCFSGGCADRWLTRHSLYKISSRADADRGLSRHSLDTCSSGGCADRRRDRFVPLLCTRQSATSGRGRATSPQAYRLHPRSSARRP